MQSISKEQLRVLGNKVMANCRRMLGFLSNVLENPDHKIPTDYIYELYVIYTHAVEEYGKFVYLSSLKRNKSGNYDIESDIFKNHKSKFEKALSVMPDNAKVVFKAPFDAKNFDEDFKIEDTLPTWKNRVNVLNVDINENGDSTDITFKVDINDLRKCVCEMYNNFPYEIKN